MEVTFEPDAEVGKVAKAYSLDAVNIAKKNFGVALDWTEESVRQAELILATLHESVNAAPSDDEIWVFAKLFGSYVGEVYRNNHGGEWGVVDMDGQKFPGVQSAVTTFWPWGRAYQRIKQGPEENIWHYYQAMIKK